VNLLESQVDKMKANLQFISQKPVQPLSINFIDEINEQKKVKSDTDQTYNKIKEMFENEHEVKEMSKSLKQNYHKLLELLEKQKKLERLMSKIEKEKDEIV